MKHLSRAIATLLVFLQLGIAQAAAEQQPCFRIFDASGFKGKPNLASYGIEPATVIYAGNHFWPGKKNMDSLPQRSAVTSMVRQWITPRRPRPALTVIDVEHWPNVGEAGVVAASVDKYLTLFQWVKEDVGNETRVSYYAIPPLRDYWRATKGADSPAYKQWQAENDRFVGLAQAVEALTPSLYTFYSDPKGWDLYAITNVSEARRLAAGKPVYPFVWPHFHEGGNQKGYIGKELWLAQLQTLERIADGVVIWAGNLEVWDNDAGWWQATEEFIANSSRVCKGPGPNAPRLHPVQPK